MPFKKDNNNYKSLEEDTLKPLLKKYNITDDVFLIYNNKITQSLNQARVNKNEILEKYFNKKLERVSKFRKYLVDINNINIKLKTATHPTSIQNMEHSKSYLLNLIQELTIKSLKSKEEIRKKIGLIDNGPYLNETGLVIPPNNNESTC